jgi:oligoendopeptidase F
MYKNKVPLIYAAGPAYFTESFGHFNELLLFDYLSTYERDTIKKKIFTAELKKRINVLYGSTMEAYVEYSLIKGILGGTIKTPDDLDRVTLISGSAVSPDLFKALPENKGLWMLFETNYQAPLHNVNDMIAAALAIRYYQLYKADKNKFIKNYIKLLKEGYTNSPGNLLKKLDINIKDADFIKEVVKFSLKK